MRNKWLTLSSAAMLGLAFINGCSEGPTGADPGRNVRPLTSLEKQTVTQSNQFSFTLFNSVCRTSGDKNVFISPLSVSYALGMALNGASGSTRSEMESVLGWTGISREDINSAYKSLSEYLIGLDPKVSLSISNSIWYKTGFPVETSFIETNKEFFKAEVASLNFTSPDAVKTINAWVDDATNHMIPKVIEQIPEEIVMYLINAVYFNGTWMFRFDENSTKDEPFTSQSGTSSTVKMMNMTGDLPYYQNDMYQVVDLPYGDSLYSMTVILPSTADGTDLLAQNLDEAQFNSMLSNLSVRKGLLSLPRIEVGYDTMLNRVLEGMGMKAAFSPEYASFPDICRGIPTYISYVQHLSYLKVNEEGTEAAAVTVVGFGATSGRGSAGFVMKVDHPFLLVIHERSSNAILFMGKIAML